MLAIRVFACCFAQAPLPAGEPSALNPRRSLALPSRCPGVLNSTLKSCNIFASNFASSGIATRCRVEPILTVQIPQKDRTQLPWCDDVSVRTALSAAVAPAPAVVGAESVGAAVALPK
jgi:hypothetical protein